jgi:hypothetical protein
VCLSQDLLCSYNFHGFCGVIAMLLQQPNAGNQKAFTLEEVIEN